MRIVHFSPFAPCACGLYEAARDMAAADYEAGHEVYLVDTGITTSNGDNHVPGEPGKEDKRGFFTVVTADPIVARTADVLICHSGVPDPWISICQAPLIWMLHGRPTACFGPEQFGRGNSYSLIAEIAKWPRVKKMITFWPYHMQFWRNTIPAKKLTCLEAPPVDSTRFNPNGPTHDFGDLSGNINIALADSWREDVDLFGVAHGALVFARENRGVKFHFYGMEQPLRCWEYILTELKELGALGEVWARRPNMEEIYRAADIILSPHRIATRVVAEALCCGTPVIAADGCRFATWTCDTNDPVNVANHISEAVNEIPGITSNKDLTKKDAENFSLINYNQSMEKIYASL